MAVIYDAGTVTAVLTLADAKTFLNITSTQYDAELQTFIDAAEGALSRRVGLMQAAASSKTKRLRASDSDSLVVPEVPLASVTSVTRVGGSAVDMSLLYVDLEAGLISYNDGSAFSDGYYDVVYTPGRADPLPDDLLMADKLIVRHLWTTQRGGEMRKPGAYDEPGTIHGAAYLYTYQINELINPYITPGFA